MRLRSLANGLLLAALVLTSVLAPLGCSGPDSPKKPAASTGSASGPAVADQSAPGRFAPIDAAGVDALSKESKGKVLLLCFWATWCPSCREEMEQLVKIRAAYKPEDLRVVAVSLDADAKALPKYFREDPVLEVRHGAPDVGPTFHLEAIPHVVIFGRDGHVAFNRPGAYPQAMLDGIIKGLVAR